MLACNSSGISIRQNSTVTYTAQCQFAPFFISFSHCSYLIIFICNFRIALSIHPTTLEICTTITLLLLLLQPVVLAFCCLQWKENRQMLPICPNPGLWEENDSTIQSLSISILKKKYGIYLLQHNPFKCLKA